MEPFIIKRGDLGVSIQVTLKDKNPVTGVETIANLVGRTVKFCMRKVTCDETTGRETLGESVINNQDAIIVDEEAGTVQYDWAEGDTDEAGTFSAEFKVLASGKPVTYPDRSYIPVQIVESLDE